MKRNYCVRRYRTYGIAEIGSHTRYFRWYWIANLYSWFWHHVGGYSCNTFTSKEMLERRRAVAWGLWTVGRF